MSDEERHFDVFYSATGECALLADSETGEKFVLRTLADTKPMSVKGLNVSAIIQDINDWVEAKGVTAAEAHHLLEAEWQFKEALYLVLMILDPTIDWNIRQQAAAEVEPVLEKDTQCAQMVRNTLWAHQLPEETGITLDDRFDERLYDNCEHLRELLRQFKLDQPKITRVRAAWDAIPADFFGDNKPELVRDKMLRSGMFLLFSNKNLPESLFDLEFANFLTALLMLYCMHISDHCTCRMV